MRELGQDQKAQQQQQLHNPDKEKELGGQELY